MLDASWAPQRCERKPQRKGELWELGTSFFFCLIQDFESPHFLLSTYFFCVFFVGFLGGSIMFDQDESEFV